ncbi:MAG: hypothetical protein HGA47_03425 [Zoogloea sp.]|nr:hypothetical protein [Zoogloea sp.]
MSSYVHDLPGRFRIKIPAIKGNDSLVHMACRRMEEQEGVLSVRGNALTGSLLVHYDVRRVTSVSLLATLEKGGFLSLSARPASRGQGPDVTDRIVNKLVESMVERSAVALIAALI